MTKKESSQLSKIEWLSCAGSTDVEIAKKLKLKSVHGLAMRYWSLKKKQLRND